MGLSRPLHYIRETEYTEFYIAEIISRFDIVAVQEVCRDLQPLQAVMSVLGDQDFDYIVSDPTEGRAGNDERLGFIFDRGKVSFKGIAGELVLPDKMEIIDGERKRQFSRTPYMCSFQSGWFRFLFSTVHIYFGDSSGPKYERRVNEIDSVAQFLARRTKKDPRNHVLVGDFNIKRPGSAGFNALQKHGFTVHQNNAGSNKDQTKFCDQMSFLARDGDVRLRTTRRSKGVLQFFESIFRPADFRSYVTELRRTVKDKVEVLQRKLAAEEGKLQRAASETRKKKIREAIKKTKDDIRNWRAHLPNTTAGKKNSRLTIFAIGVPFTPATTFPSG